jgi:hypothetical protein
MSYEIVTTLTITDPTGDTTVMDENVAPIDLFVPSNPGIHNVNAVFQISITDQEGITTEYDKSVSLSFEVSDQQPVLLGAGDVEEAIEQPYPAVAGQPVLQKKIVKIEQEGPVVVETGLPSESYKIDVSSEEEAIEGDVDITVNDITLPLEDYNEEVGDTPTGGAIFSGSGKGFFSKLISFFVSLFKPSITGRAVSGNATGLGLEINDIAHGDTTTYEVFYELPPPEVTETQVDADTKQVVVSSEQQSPRRRSQRSGCTG